MQYKKNVIPFLVTYSPTLPNIREIINRHRHILYIKNTFKNVFKATPVIAFCRNTNQWYKYNQSLSKTSEGQAKCD